MICTGADLCRGGWFTVTLRDGHWQYELFPDIVSLWNAHRNARLILIDIPIGLKDSGSEERRCDIAARRLLGARRSSIFRVPCRDAVYAESYEESSRVNAEKTGKKLPCQMWGIVPRIREVDRLLLTDEPTRSRFRESHPELCFWAMSGGQPMKFGKSKEAGFHERLRVLSTTFPDTATLVTVAMNQYRRRELARDDIVDALVLAVTARRNDLRAVPQKIARDSKGLPMQIWY